MSDPAPAAPGPPEREQGFLLIADMESSTASKFVLGEEAAFGALREHNRLIMDHCRKAAPVEGIIVNSLGDAVVAKFPYRHEEGAGDALASCLRAARDVVHAFESLPPIRRDDGGEFRLRTKLTLQKFDAYRYGRREGGTILAEELVGPDIDLAFRLSAVSWRLQVLVSEAFAAELLSRSIDPSAEDPARHGLEPRTLLNRAHIARHFGALLPGPLQGVSEHFRLEATGGDLDWWVTDAREIARLKGVGGAQSTYAIAFESPESLLERGEAQRLTIKVRQDHHAVILASIRLGRDRNDSYIEHVVQMLRDSSDGHRLDSELTLCVAAKIYGEYDFFFRVSCIDDLSLRRFFQEIHDDSFGVSHVEVRSTLSDRFAVTRRYDAILRHYEGRPYELVLAWFERDAERDLFELFRGIVEREEADVQPVEILEVGEVIHHTPVYAIFICESLRDYQRFFRDHSLRPTACRSHIGHIDRPGEAQLRYTLMSGVYTPRR